MTCEQGPAAGYIILGNIYSDNVSALSMKPSRKTTRPTSALKNNAITHI
jgi:hypothetical protein